MQTQLEIEARVDSDGVTDDPIRVNNAKILIVDDEPINVKIVQKYLGMEGYQGFSDDPGPIPSHE